MDVPDPDCNYYEILLVSPDATPDAIRSSYRTLMQRHRAHPDLGGDTETAAMINKAYAVLGDADRRAQYDAYLEAVRLAGKGIDFAATGSQPQPRDLYRECAFCGTAHDFGQVILADADCASCQSPLAPIDSLRLEATGQRAVARIDKQRPIKVYTEWPHGAALAARMEDISLQGLRILTKTELKPGQHVKISCRALDAIATVTHCRRVRRRGATMHVSGLAFVTCRFRQAVGRFVSDRI